MVSEKVVHFQACQMATTNSVKQHKLRRLIAWLSDKEGRGKKNPPKAKTPKSGLRHEHNKLLQTTRLQNII
jgi:hypothetical protein